METATKQHFIRSKALALKIKWSSHAIAELTPEALSVPEIELMLRRAEVIEDYPHVHRFLPDCLVLIFIPDNKPVHAVIAINESQDYILVVTVYRPTEKEWKSDWRTRK